MLRTSATASLAAASHPQAEFAVRTRCVNCGSAELDEISSGRFADDPLARFLKEDPNGEDALPYFQEARWSLVKCRCCTQVFHSRVLTDKWNEKRFSDWMTADAMKAFEDKSPTPAATRKFEAARDFVTHILRIENLTQRLRGNGEPVRLLDFGSGWGSFVAACRQFGFDAVGVDRAAPRIAASAAPVFPSMEAIGAETKFHAVTLFEVLEHLDEPLAILKMLSERMLPGGLLILETPDCTGVTGIASYSDYLKVHPLEHINAFTHDTLKSIAARAGFTVISKGPAHVTTEFVRVTKREAKSWLGRDSNSTQLYFRKDLA